MILQNAWSLSLDSMSLGRVGEKATGGRACEENRRNVGPCVGWTEPKRGQDGDLRGHSSSRGWGALKATLKECAENWVSRSQGQGPVPFRMAPALSDFNALRQGPLPHCLANAGRQCQPQLALARVINARLSPAPCSLLPAQPPQEHRLIEWGLSFS